MEIDIAIEHAAFTIDGDLLVSAARRILSDHNMSQGALSIAVVDDETIHRMNVESLNHDYPTDVLSFLYEHRGEHLEGEIIVSSDTALSRAEEFEMKPASELLLYVIHGALHLVGYEDDTAEAKQQMRVMEEKYLKEFA